MTTANYGAGVGDLRFGAHVLWVEGQSAGTSRESLDVAVLSELLGDTKIAVDGLGTSANVRAAADALYRFHPEYYFLIDRDHYEDDLVDRAWERFPDSNTSNILIWRRRQIENYFLDADYFARSRFVTCGVEDIQRRLLDEAKRRVYFDAANLVIIDVREEVKRRGIQCFTDPNSLATAQAAEAALLALPQWSEKMTLTQTLLSGASLRDRFHDMLQRLTGGSPVLTLGTGRWLDLMEGKPLFRHLVNHCCSVVDLRGTRVTGREAEQAVAKHLARLPEDQLPADFRRLRALVSNKLRPVTLETLP